MMQWLRSFPIDEDGTPSGKITPGIYYFTGIIVIITTALIYIVEQFP